MQKQMPEQYPGVSQDQACEPCEPGHSNEQFLADFTVAWVPNNESLQPGQTCYSSQLNVNIFESVH